MNEHIVRLTISPLYQQVIEQGLVLCLNKVLEKLSSLFLDNTRSLRPIAIILYFS